MATDEDVDHLRGDDGGEARRRRLQVERVVRGQRDAVLPAGRMKHEEEHGQGGSCLQRPEPTVGARQQCPGEQALVRATRRLAHHRRIGRLGAERQRRHHVGAEIDGENLDDRQRQRDAQ